jgi:hypothetical protein
MSKRDVGHPQSGVQSAAATLEIVKCDDLPQVMRLGKCVRDARSDEPCAPRYEDALRIAVASHKRHRSISLAERGGD